MSYRVFGFWRSFSAMGVQSFVGFAGKKKRPLAEPAIG
jgi:hypothetical protein